jgi:hypothetical protein
MSYILRKTDGRGGYVAPAGSARSYVRNPAFARVFATLEEAEAERCVKNEVVVSKITMCN